MIQSESNGMLNNASTQANEVSNNAQILIEDTPRQPTTSTSPEPQVKSPC